MVSSIPSSLSCLFIKARSSQRTFADQAQWRDAELWTAQMRDALPPSG